MIDGEIYHILSVGRFSSTSSGRLSDEVKSFLEKVDAFQKEAERLFGTRKVGVLVFVNDSEPDIPIDEVKVRKGDIIEIAYTGEGPESKESQKDMFFEGSDKRHYSEPYRRENEWRKPKGA